MTRNGAPISCHDAAALARSRWTSAADENAPIDAVARRTMSTAAVVPPWAARRSASTGTRPRPRAGDPAEDPERHGTSRIAAQPDGDARRGPAPRR